MIDAAIQFALHPELHRIDVCIRLNYMLVSGGRHPAVDYKAVWSAIDLLLEKRHKLTATPPPVFHVKNTP